MIMRILQHHFGIGLSATPDNLGQSGARPTHPELLDWLASEFIGAGWSLKHLHRLIVTSATYRQSAVDALAITQTDAVFSIATTTESHIANSSAPPPDG